MQPLHFLSVHLLLPVKEKHSWLSEIQCIYLCIYMKCDAGRILLPETLDALGLEPSWNQLEPFVHDSVSIFPNFMEMYHWASPAAVRGLVDVMSEWHNVRNSRIPPAKSISGLLPWLSTSPVQQCHTRHNWLPTYSTEVKFCSLKPNQSKSLCFLPAGAFLRKPVVGCKFWLQVHLLRLAEPSVWEKICAGVASTFTAFITTPDFKLLVQWYNGEQWNHSLDLILNPQLFIWVFGSHLHELHVRFSLGSLFGTGWILSSWSQQL